MIYNFVQLLRDQFTTETIYCNIRQQWATDEFVEDRCLVVTETGGTEQPWTLFSKPTVQIIARDMDGPKARKFAHDVFEFLTSRFGLKMPAATVDGTVFPEVQTAQISAIQRPYSLGVDENGRILFTTNYEIIFTRS